ncbi:MAG: thioester reductase domain-containing protein [Inconstantimicrobium porci]|uniref:thioester reductase domain-containing protein n=2 Tax=Inconstantimicrobium porci TaxID=2652291 RepID=UPI002A9117A2|nr:thioester reductase domain-containing protein [Inconstantimicrobium porci]MDY5912046.1 thioester reductase domain-containing protein [Inconstantimicrobium porci]
MKYYIKSGQESFYNILMENVVENSDEICFTFCKQNKEKDIKLTRSELLEKSLNVASEIKNRGAAKGDRIVIMSTQSEDNVISVAASILAGTIFSIIPPPVDSKKIERFKSVYESCKPRFILCSGFIYNEITKIINSIIGDDNDVNVICADECNSHTDFICENIGFDDTVYIQYTSGSTSAPKGIEVSYGNILSAVNSICDVYKFRRVVGWVPFFHNLGLVYLMMASIVNKRVVAAVISPKDFLENPIIWIERLSDFKADVTLAPNSAYEAYPKLVPADKLTDIDLTSLKVMANGSEVVSPLSLWKFASEYKRFGISTNKFYIGYGLSEATCGISAGRYDKNNNLYVDLSEYKKGRLRVVDQSYKNSICFVSSGPIMRGTKVVIVNPHTLKKCRDNEFGEIWINSTSAAKGYYNDEKATKDTFNVKLKGEHGRFLRTGDMGIVRNNQLYITGRLKELIIINGNNILPNDIIEKLKENVQEINGCVIAPFSIVKENKERLIILVEGLEEVENEKEIRNKINLCIFKYFDVSPYDIQFINKGYIIKSDNGKVSLTATCKKYEMNSNNNVKVVRYEGATEKAIGKIIEDEFSYKADRDDNLLSLGMDSLEVVSLAALIESKFNIAINVSFIFENPSINKISKYIDKSLKGEDLSVLEKDKAYLYDEVKLEEYIKPAKYRTDKPEMKNIFLTGTTGFLGAYLISELIKKTKGRIYCHVRAKTRHEGFERIKENMKYYDLWNDKYNERLTPVIGSLDEDNLGINQREYNYLCDHVDTVYHCGALLNFIYPYSRLKETNVLGTIRTIKFACSGKAKYYNYISSYSVYDNPSHFKKDAYEDDVLDDCRGYFLSYSESKWVSENIIKEAKRRGLRAAIYRPGEITGDTEIGTWKLSDAVSRTIRSMIVTGTYPDLPMRIHMTQVDFVAQAIVFISSEGSSYGRSYNLLNKKYVSLDWIGDILNSMGISVIKIPFDEWKKNLFNSNTEHPLKLLESLFKVEKQNENESFVKRYGENSPKYHMENTDQALLDTGINCEEMNDEILRRYIKNFL